MTDQETKPIDPIPNMEDQWYWEAADRGEFLGERCSGCHRFRNPPRPMCPHCHSVEREHVALSGRGKVEAWGAPTHPHPFGYDSPPVVALVEVEEGFRLMTGLVGVGLEDVTMGMDVTVDFLPTSGGHQLPVFRPSKHS